MAGGLATLTAREEEVLRLLAAGHTAKSAAIALNLSVHTVNDYLREARKKLGVASSREAARILVQEGKSSPDYLGHERMGIGIWDQSVHQEGPRNRTADLRSRVALIVGGTAMLASAVALILVATTPSATEPVPTPQQLTTQEQGAAQQAARDWVALIDGGRWELSWQRAGAVFQQAVTADAWASQVKPVRSPLGAVATRTVRDVTAHSELPGAPAGSYRIVQFNTKFAAAPNAVETVVLVDEGGEWKVVGYFIK